MEISIPVKQKQIRWFWFFSEDWAWIYHQYGTTSLVTPNCLRRCNTLVKVLLYSSPIAWWQLTQCNDFKLVTMLFDFKIRENLKKLFNILILNFFFIFTVTGRGLADAEFASLMVATWSFDNIKIVMNNSGVYIITVTRIQNCKLEMYIFFF